MTLQAETPPPSGHDDEVLTALDDVVEELEQTKQRTTVALRRAQLIRRLRAQGRSYREIVQSGQRPLVVQLLSQMIDGLRSAGSRFRRATAQALRRDGMTTDEIARLFGVSRQRVSKLVHTGGQEADTEH
jgi:hypothetical protein